MFNDISVSVVYGWIHLVKVKLSTRVFLNGLGTRLNFKALDIVKKYKPIVEKSEQDKFDVAASLQLATERVAYSVIKPYIEKYKPTNICFSGGVILNSVMMGKMYDWFGI